MKKHYLAFVLAAIIGTVCAASCGASVESSIPQPEKTRATSATMAVTTEPSATQSASTKATEATKATTKAKTKSRARASVNSTPRATQSPTAPTNIPPDSISGANINPNLNTIAGRVSADIAARQVSSISLSKSDIELEVGESTELSVTYYPDNAMYKLCTAKVGNGCVIVSTNNRTVTVKAKSAGTTVLTVTSSNGHKATCNITVKRNEEITDDTKLDHADLCTASNVNRWVANLTAECQKLGMTQSASLKGADIAIDTADGKGKKQSFNEVNAAYVQTAKSQLAALVTGEYKDYVFNCYSESKGGGEYFINIVVEEKQQ